VRSQIRPFNNCAVVRHRYDLADVPKATREPGDPPFSPSLPPDVAQSLERVPEVIGQQRGFVKQFQQADFGPALNLGAIDAFTRFDFSPALKLGALDAFKQIDFGPILKLEALDAFKQIDSGPALKLEALDAFKQINLGPVLKLEALEGLKKIELGPALKLDALAAFKQLDFGPVLKLQTLDAFKKIDFGPALKLQAIGAEIAGIAAPEFEDWGASSDEARVAVLRAWYRSLDFQQRRGLQDALLGVVVMICGLVPIATQSRDTALVVQLMGICLAVIILLSRIEDTQD